MILSSYAARLDRGEAHEDAQARFDYISEHLNKYFEKIYMSVSHPYAMVLGVELILQNEALGTSRSFSTLTGQRGSSAMESYRIEADLFAQMTVVGNGRHQHKPFWMLEGHAMRRWSSHRTIPYTFHEAFWMSFLARYCDAGKNKIELLVFETLEVYRRKIDPDNCRIDPTRLFHEVVYDALVGTHLDCSEPLPLDSFMQEHSQKVIERIGR